MKLIVIMKCPECGTIYDYHLIGNRLFIPRYLSCRRKDCDYFMCPIEIKLNLVIDFKDEEGK